MRTMYREAHALYFHNAVVDNLKIFSWLVIWIKKHKHTRAASEVSKLQMFDRKWLLVSMIDFESLIVGERGA